MSHLNDGTASSQYPNKIVPLSNMNNAPFEQTFRITVCLPRDQLYVARLGAKSTLNILLQMVCNDKCLDINKYEFRHPADNSMPFSNDLTIGQVGLNELRLVAKTEKYHNNNFNTDEIVRLRQHHPQNSSNKSSSLTSPYSSTNSLNSIDSSGMSSSSRGGIVSLNPHPPVVPARKKRAAPRPPSQNSIPENKDINFNNQIKNEFKEPQSVIKAKNFYVSSPNLATNYGNNEKQTHSNINNNNIKNNFNHINNNNHNLNNNMQTKKTVEEEVEEEQNYHVNEPIHHQQKSIQEQHRYNSVNELNQMNERRESMSSLSSVPQQQHQTRPASMIVTDVRRISNGGNGGNYINGGTNGHHSIAAINHSRTSSDSSETTNPEIRGKNKV